MRIRMLFVVAAVGVIALFFAGAASADPVGLINPLMEDPMLIGPLSGYAPGQYPYPTWQGPGVSPPYDSVGDGQLCTHSPSGWQVVYGSNPAAGENVGEYNPTSKDFPGADGNGNLPSPLGIVQTTIGGMTDQGQTITTGVTNTLYGGALPAPTLGSQAMFNTSTVDNDICFLTNTRQQPPSFSSRIRLTPGRFR